MTKTAYRVLVVDVGKKTWELREYSLNEVLGPIDVGIKLHLEELESWRYDPFDPSNALILGAGALAGGKLFGAHRLVTVFRSPETLGLHVATMGGAAYRFIGCGVHAVAVVGRANRPAIVLIRGNEKGVEKVEFIELEPYQLESIYAGYGGKKGAYALEKWIIDTLWSFVSETRARPIVVGPAAWRTIFGALISIDVDFSKRDLAEGSEEFAARGGPGSVLAQAHNVAAIVAGGSWRPELPKALTDIAEISKLTQEVLGKDYMTAVTGATKKYRFDPHYGAGGTFGVNYPHYRELLPLFNFNSIYLRKEIRKRIADLIIEHYWKPFKEEVFDKTKAWRTCGEPCPVACKKVWRGKKVDYEPFEGVGPLIGVMKLEEAAKVVDEIDQLGFDAIELGHIVAWLLEAVYRGLLEPEEVGISSRPILDPLLMNVDLWAQNARLALEIVRGLATKRTEVLKLVAELGVRRAAKILDDKYAARVNALGIRFEDLAIYLPFGECGYMTPNFYWTPGFIAPIFVTGRYWTNYSTTFAEPEEYAKTVFTRALKEYEIDNAGFCRFHRGWAEKLLQKLYEALGVSIDIDEHAKEMYRKIAEYDMKAGARPRFLESEKAKDLIASLAAELGVSDWIEKFSKDRDAALREWWTRFAKALAEMLGIDPNYAES